MAGEPEKESASASLSNRADRYKQEAERVVREVGEHPLFELKRSCALTELAEKIEFVKDVQSICTSKVESEKYLVIGADEKARTFVNVDNLADFEDAKVRQLLEKYLQPTPLFEVFAPQSSDGKNFVLFVFPRQKTRCIVAKVSVDHPSQTAPKVLLRKGDLWTKGSSTAKRLASAKDWDEIYEDFIEFETERRTRQRTAHLLERATAQEKLRGGHALPSIPGFGTDEEFKVLIESLCISQDRARFLVLLEGLRDDLVEGWHAIGAFDPDHGADIQASLPEYAAKVRDHKTNVFLPAMQKLTSAVIYVIKNGGPPEFLAMAVQLLEEVYETTDSLRPSYLCWLHRRGLMSDTSTEHLSHTVPALESLVSLHLIGAYSSNRRKFEYLPSLLRTVVRAAGADAESRPRQPLAFWPLVRDWGEPKALEHRAGRIDLCADRIQKDPVLLKLFGSKTGAIGSLCQYELLLELNSFLAVDEKTTPASATAVKKQYPGVDFRFRPSLIAFPLGNIMPMALRLFTAIRDHDQDLLKSVLFDPGFVHFLTADGGNAFIKMLSHLSHDRDGLLWELQRVPDFNTVWPKEIADAMKGLEHE